MFCLFVGNLQEETLRPDYIYVMICVIHDYKGPQDEEQTQASIDAERLWKMGRSTLSLNNGVGIVNDNFQDLGLRVSAGKG